MQMVIAFKHNGIYAIRLVLVRIQFAASETNVDEWLHILEVSFNAISFYLHF